MPKPTAKKPTIPMMKLSNGVPYAIAADEKAGRAELKMYGEVVEERPVDWWTGEEIKGDYIIAPEVVGSLEKLGKCKKLHIRLNSIGGEVNAAILIYNRLRELSRNGTEIDCTVDGIAMSAGSMIMCAADHISVSHTSLVMIHKAIRLVRGWLNADDLQKLAGEVDKYDEILVSAYKRKTGLGEEELLAMMSETTYLTGKEAKAKGFADEIYESESKAEIAACADKKALMINGRRFSLQGMHCPENIPVISERNDPPDIDNSKDGGNTTMAKDLSELIKENPELAAKVQEELTVKISAEVNAKAAEKAAAQIEAERKRLEEIDAVAFKVDAETLKAAKYGDTACSAGEMLLRAALKDKEKGAEFISNMQIDSQSSEVSKVESAADPGRTMTEKEVGLAFIDKVLKGKENG